MASDLPVCECCEEPWCFTHHQHYADCECVGPDNAEEQGLELREIYGRLYGVPITRSDTPETDEAAFVAKAGNKSHDVVAVAFAERLERERDKLRAEIESMNADINLALLMIEKLKTTIRK